MKPCTAFEDRVVAAARAPAHLLVGLEVLRRQLDQVAVAVAHARPTQRRDRLGQLGRPERQAAHAVVADRVDEELGPHELQQLARVHLRDEHLLVAAQHLAGVARERVQVVEVRAARPCALGAHPPHGGADRAVRRAPAEHEHVARRRRGRRPRAAGCRRRCSPPSARAAGPSGRGCRGRTRSHP